MSGHWEHKSGKPVWVTDIKEADPLEVELANSIRKYQLPVVEKEVQEVVSYIMSVTWAYTQEKGQYWSDRHDNINLLSDEDIDKLIAYHEAQHTGCVSPWHKEVGETSNEEDDEDDDDEEEKLIEYIVDFSKTEYYSASVRVEAKDEDDARDKAYEIIRDDDVHWEYCDSGEIEITDVTES